MRFRLMTPLAALVALAMIAFGVGTASAAPAPAAAPVATGTISSPVDFTSPDGSFAGNFTPQHFTNNHGQLLVTGLLTGAVTQGQTTQAIDPQTITMAVLAADPPVCTILDLTLGPLHLNLLGLHVDLNTVHLTITAVPGPGNLLGNLLCAVANLLNGGGPLGALSGLLNRILALLQGL